MIWAVPGLILNPAEPPSIDHPARRADVGRESGDPIKSSETGEHQRVQRPISYSMP
jgi:hypothetical protein